MQTVLTSIKSCGIPSLNKTTSGRPYSQAHLIIHPLVVQQGVTTLLDY